MQDTHTNATTHTGTDTSMAANTSADGSGHTHTIEDNNAFLVASGQNSRIEIHTADAAKDSWTQITQTASAGATTLTLAEDTQWEIGDTIVIAASGFDMNEAEERTITNISPDGRTITLNRALEHDHFGEIKTYDNGLTGADYREWEADLRAEVALLSRNVTIQGDAGSATDGYGGHIMAMNGNPGQVTEAEASIRMNGVELTHMGQEGIVGRYPLHWHMLGDASGQYLLNSSIHHTFNKGLTIHGTHNTWVENVAIHDTIGHTYYFEDGSEHGNMIKGSLGMTTRQAPDLEAAPIGSDVTDVSTYWVTNPANHLVDNHAAGSADTGFWILSQNAVQGQSAEAPEYDGYAPRSQTPGHWTGNSSHSNGDDGWWIGSEFEEKGDPERGLEKGDKIAEPLLTEAFLLKDYTTYSNDGWGIWQRHANGEYEDLKILESEAGLQMWGSSRVSDSLFVGRAINAGDSAKEQYVGLQLYDNVASYTDIHFEGFTDPSDAAISNGWGFGRSTVHTVEGLTFAEDGTQDVAYRYTLNNDKANFIDRISEKGGSVAGGVRDLDGSLTGIPGATMTPAIVDYVTDRFVTVNGQQVPEQDQGINVLTYADPTLEASGFNASAGAVYLDGPDMWVHQPDAVIGKMYIRQKIRDEAGGFKEVTNELAGERITYSIARSDTGATIEINPYAVPTHSGAVQLNVDSATGIEYIFDFASEAPTMMELELVELPQGTQVLYRFQNLPEGVVFQTVTPAADLDAFNAATETTWLREEASGDYLVKLVTLEVDFRRPLREETDPAENRTYIDKFQMIVLPTDSDLPSDDSVDGRPLIVEDTPNLLALPSFEERSARIDPDTGEPLPPPTVDISPDDARWSDAATWGGALPGLDDIVVIGAGQRVVLDTYAWVKAIYVNGGELVVEDTKDLKLAADWIMVDSGGLFQVGTEDNPFVHDFDLTLEGDDRQNDVNLGALALASGEGILRPALTPDPEAGGTTQRSREDIADTAIWSYLTDTFDDSGARIARTLSFDDGRLAERFYEGGVVQKVVLHDAANTRGWDKSVTLHGPDGKPEARTLFYDDGRIAETTFQNGTLASRTILDPDNAVGWSSIVIQFDAAGDFQNRVLTQDNGRVVTTDYVGGIQSKTVVEDAGNAYAWAQFENLFDASGTITQSTRSFDDGRVWNSTYTNGTLAQTVQRDLGETRDWTEITLDYTDGRLVQKQTLSDSGRVLTETYQGGTLAERSTQFEDNPLGLSSITERFAENGARISYDTVYTDGTTEDLQFVSLVQAVNFGFQSYTASNGLVYQADPFGTGVTFSQARDIAGTENDGLYQIQRWQSGELAYEIAVENGTYLLELNFAEIFFGNSQPGQRVFDIYVEDELVFDNFDIVSLGGFDTAVDLLGGFTVEDGALSLRMVSSASSPSIAGLSIWTAEEGSPSGFILGSVSDMFEDLL